MPTLVVSPYARRGYVSGQVYEHSSILKFVERNWGLAPITARSRDNLPNPKVDSAHPYIPTNSPALSDLWGAFDFGR